MSLTELLIEVHEAQAKLQDGVFRNAPSEWPGFQRMLGKWLGLEAIAVRLEDIIEGDKRNDQ